MCVLIVKPAGVKVPSKEILRACCKANPDGFGFAVNNRRFHTLDAEEFIREVSGIDTRANAIIHCRWATTGSVNTSNCHPFYDAETNSYMAHNGVLPFHPKEDITDSEFAFRQFIVPSIKRNGFESSAVASTVARIIGTSKFALMHGSRIRMFGRFEKVDGIYYSNLRFMSYLRDPLDDFWWRHSAI